MANKEAFLTFWKGSKIISRRDYLRPCEDWREGAKGAEMVAAFEVSWFYLPTRAAVVLDGWRYYFRITYTDRQERGRVVHLPDFHYTARRRAT